MLFIWHILVLVYHLISKIDLRTKRLKLHRDVGRLSTTTISIALIASR